MLKTTIKKETQKLIKAIKKDSSIYMICPICGRGDLQYNHVSGYWFCYWTDCPFHTSEIPSKEEIRYLINLKASLQKIKDWGI